MTLSVASLGYQLPSTLFQSMYLFAAVALVVAVSHVVLRELALGAALFCGGLEMVRGAAGHFVFLSFRGK